MSVTHNPDATPAAPTITPPELLSLPAPAVRPVVINGVSCVAVELSGVHGFGREMLLDADDWTRVSTEITQFWSVAKINGKDYVYSGTTTAAAIARQTSKSTMLHLARFLAQPGKGQNVRFIDGDNLNLTRGNLAIVDRSTHSRLNGVKRRANTLRREAERRASAAQAPAA
jgi:hypothetical protein